jgi:hypothetical protein
MAHVMNGERMLASVASPKIGEAIASPIHPRTLSYVDR